MKINVLILGVFIISVNVVDMKITKLEDVDPMIDDIAVKARCISLWHSHRKNEEKNPYSLDCVLQDEEV